jgi:hypothetical protein
LLLLNFIQAFYAFHMSDNDWLYIGVEEKRLAFERNEHPPPSTQIITRFNKLLREDASTLSNMSSGRQSVRTRVRDLAKHIYEELSGEVLLLVVLVVNTVDKMLEVKQEGLINYLKTWWNTVVHPASLTNASSMLIVVHARHKAIGVAQNFPVEAASGDQHAAAAFGKWLLFLLA